MMMMTQTVHNSKNWQSADWGNCRISPWLSKNCQKVFLLSEDYHLKIKNGAKAIFRTTIGKIWILSTHNVLCSTHHNRRKICNCLSKNCNFPQRQFFKVTTTLHDMGFWPRPLLQSQYGSCSVNSAESMFGASWPAEQAADADDWPACNGCWWWPCSECNGWVADETPETDRQTERSLQHACLIFASVWSDRPPTKHQASSLPCDWVTWRPLTLILPRLSRNVGCRRWRADRVCQSHNLQICKTPRQTDLPATSRHNQKVMRLRPSVKLCQFRGQIFSHCLCIWAQKLRWQNPVVREPGTTTSPWSADRSLVRAATVWAGVITRSK